MTETSETTRRLLDTLESARLACQELPLADLKAAVSEGSESAEALEEALSQLQRSAQQLRSACRSMSRQATKAKIKGALSGKGPGFPGPLHSSKVPPLRRQSPRSLWAHNLLGVAVGATAEDLKARYHELLRATHPDTRVQEPSPHLPSFEDVREAWVILKDEGIL